MNTKLALTAPSPVGVNVTSTELFPPAGIVIGNAADVNVYAGSDDVILVITNAPSPLLVIVTGIVLFVPTLRVPKLKEVGANTNAGANTCPVPESGNDVGDPEAL